MEATPRVTFHNHEVVGARQTYDFMKRLGFRTEECEKVAKLVRYHQFRFYEDTTDKAIIKWMQALGREGWTDMINVRKADRAGNVNNDGKPIMYKELKELTDRCFKLIAEKKVRFKEDLQIRKEDLGRLGVPKEKQSQCFSDLLGYVTADRKRNQKQLLVKFVKRNYSFRSTNDGDTSSVA